MATGKNRISREKKTVQVMVEMYCRSHHGSGRTLCRDCAALMEYSLKRLDSCRFGEHKPACSKCVVHCYEQSKREQMRAVMKYSGPRMMTRHPVMAFRHAADRRRKAPRTSEKG